MRGDSAHIRFVIVAASIAAIGLSATPALAQDAHYWTEQFGNRAFLLAGAVVGDPADLSALYYNPGGFALNESTEILLAGIAIEFTRRTVKEALADGSDLTKTRTGFVPTLIAGEIPVEKEGHRFGYAILTRHKTDLRALAKVDLGGDVFAIPTLELVSNTMQIDTSLREYWYGGTWAYRARPNLGIGASTFLVYRNQRRLGTSFLQILSTDNRAAVIDSLDSYDFKHWRLLWKIGAAGRVANWDLGLTFTTRSLGLFGSGDAAVNATAVGQAVDEEGNPLTFIATDTQEDLSANYKSPFSVAAGASRTFGSMTLHLSAEWFEKVSLYEILDAEPFESQTSPDVILDASVRQRLDSVFNFGVGTEYMFNGGMKAYAGFHTDFAGASRDPASNLSISKWDLYHLAGGATFNFRGTDITAGANLALANDTIESNADDPFRPITLPDETDVRIAKLTLILGFNFSIL